jgi:hypothetical protein
VKKPVVLFVSIIVFILNGCISYSQKTDFEATKTYDIDFNWGEGGPDGFARPGLWIDAVPPAIQAKVDFKDLPGRSQIL